MASLVLSGFPSERDAPPEDAAAGASVPAFPADAAVDARSQQQRALMLQWQQRLQATVPLQSRSQRYPLSPELADSLGVEAVDLLRRAFDEYDVSRTSARAAQRLGWRMSRDARARALPGRVMPYVPCAQFRLLARDVGVKLGRQAAADVASSLAVESFTISRLYGAGHGMQNTFTFEPFAAWFDSTVAEAVDRSIVREHRRARSRLRACCARWSPPLGVRLAMAWAAAWAANATLGAIAIAYGRSFGPRRTEQLLLGWLIGEVASRGVEVRALLPPCPPLEPMPSCLRRCALLVAGCCCCRRRRLCVLPLGRVGGKEGCACACIIRVCASSARCSAHAHT